jgi:hypothetical protein
MATITLSQASHTDSVTSSKAQLWTGRVLSGIAVAFLTFDAAGKLFRVAPVVEGTATLGYPASSILPMGILLTIGLVLYLVRRTSVLGAIWISGFLGGAIATHLRVGSPLFSHILFPIYVALFIWGGLVLRSPRLRALIFEGA